MGPMMTQHDRRHTVSIDAIKQGLIDQIESVVARFAPPASGSYRKGEVYYTLNPMRHDTSVGSFCINMGGAQVGQWHDFAMNGRQAHGDLIDLIGGVLGLSPADAIREARQILGLENDTPEARRAREQGAERAKQMRAQQAEEARKKAAQKRKWAQGLWLSGHENLRGTPVDLYLQGRGIDFARLGRVPRALRYHGTCTYWADYEQVDETTGEVLCDAQGRPIMRRDKLALPAMVSAITGLDGTHLATHRTYLAQREDGTWGKAAIPDAKKVLGDYRGGCIRLSSGIGPRGGKAGPLKDCAPGTKVYIGEGIETCLTAVMALPHARVLAAVSLANMAAVELPAGVTEVVLLADNDQNDQARASFQAAVDAHAAKGRLVRVKRSAVPGEDLNDELQRMLRERGAA